MSNVKKFIDLLNSPVIQKYIENNCKHKEVISQELKNSCREYYEIEITEKNMMQIIWDRNITGLSLDKNLQYAFLEKRKKNISKDKNKPNFIYELNFTPQYKGLLWKARENGYDIQCNYILYCEKSSFKVDQNNNTIFIDNTQRLTLPCPNIPKLSYTNQNTITDELLKYEWKPYDIIGFYIIVKDNATYKNIRIDYYNLAEIIERTMEIDNYNKIKKIKNKMLQDYLNNEAMMITNVIEALKIRAIRLSCKTLNEQLSEITNIIDISDGYLNRNEETNFEKYKQELLLSENLENLRTNYNICYKPQ